MLLVKDSERRRHTGDVRGVCAAIIVNLALVTKLFSSVAKPHKMDSELLNPSKDSNAADLGGARMSWVQVVPSQSLELGSHTAELSMAPFFFHSCL